MTAITGPALLRAAADRLDQIDRSAVSGPWRVDDPDYPCRIVSDEGNPVDGHLHGGSVFGCDDDAHLIAAMRGIVPVLAAWLRGVAEADEGGEHTTIGYTQALAVARKVMQ